jgi:hypothetical protein
MPDNQWSGWWDRERWMWRRFWRVAMFEIPFFVKKLLL